VLPLGIALIAIGVVTTAFVKHKDEDNQFCVSCHLHQEHMDGMTKMPAGTLAAAHHAAQDGSGHPERCFTCHSGEGVVGWTQVTVLSAWDAGRWVLGDRHEPTTMRLPITSQACLKCHADDLRKLPRDETRFHGLSDHRRVGIPCVSCHRVHDAGPKNNDFLDNANVRTQCQRCHRDLEEF
jgi:predicted CXXCH cytochrome family protein